MWLHSSQNQIRYNWRGMHLAESLLEDLGGEKENPMLLNWYTKIEEITTEALLGVGKLCGPVLIFARVFDKLSTHEDMSHTYLLGQK